MELQENLVHLHMVQDFAKNEHETVRTLRHQSIETFEKKGFPTTHDEDWKYSNLKPILKGDFKLKARSEAGLDYKDVKKFFIHDIDSYKIVFVNGIYSSFLSQTTHQEGDICILSSAFVSDSHKKVIDQYYGKIQKEESISALNTAFAREGAYIYIPDNVVVSRPIQIIYFNLCNSENQYLNYPRNLVVLGNNAQATIIERYQTLGENAVVNMAVNEASLGKNAHLDWYKIQNDTENSSLIDNTFITQERDSVASVHTFSLGGKFTRNNLNFYQNDENCNSILKGLTVGDKNQLIDHHTLIHHKSPNCESHELYKGIMDGKSSGVFNGKVIVDKIAQKINAFQQNNTILLSDSASIDTKPQLEIFADDVRCSHGCTVGQLDEEALFYLKSRGIPEKEARAILMFAFASEVLEEVKIMPLLERIKHLLAQKLEVALDLD